MNGHIIDNSKALDFILAGKSLFTVKNSQSQNRFTFKVTKHKKEDIFFVKVLTNPNVYEFIGTIIDKSFYHSKKSRISSNSQSFKVFSYILNKLNDKSLPSFIEIWHEGHCGKCGKTLTDPDSIITGFGPFCSKSLNK